MSYVTWEIILRDFWAAILRGRQCALQRFLLFCVDFRIRRLR